MLNIGPQELILILIVALVVVGPQRLPELGRTIGKVLREFRKIQTDVKDTIKFDLDDDPAPYVRPRTSPGTSPRTPSLPENGEVTAKEPPTPAGTPDPGASTAPGGGQPGTEATTETEIDPEPRAVE
jgi:Tat protein translocase TatB subunit